MVNAITVISSHMHRKSSQIEHTKAYYLARDFVVDGILCYKCTDCSRCLHSCQGFILQDSCRENILVLCNCCYSNIFMMYMPEKALKSWRKIIYWSYSPLKYKGSIVYFIEIWVCHPSSSVSHHRCWCNTWSIKALP